MGFDINREADKELRNHVAVEVPSRAFHFHQPVPVRRYVPLKQKEITRFSPSSTFAFTLTWAPGVLTLSGDIGELSIVHYSNLDTFEDAIFWALKADYSYLMEKSGVQKVYDPQATYESILKDANRDVIAAVMGEQVFSSKLQRYVMRGGFRDDMRSYREGVNEAVVDFEKGTAAWQDGDRSTEQPVLKDFMPFDPRENDEYRDFQSSNGKMWRDWKLLWEHLGHGEPENILKAQYRREIRSHLRDLCDNQHELVEMMHEMGYEDYYGTEIYPDRSRWQIAAIKHGCQLLVDHLNKEAA
jgi:hypothetical protein